MGNFSLVHEMLVFSTFLGVRCACVCVHACIRANEFQHLSIKRVRAGDGTAGSMVALYVSAGQVIMISPEYFIR